jgi:hypothetical protein
VKMMEIEDVYVFALYGNGQFPRDMCFKTFGELDIISVLSLLIRSLDSTLHSYWKFSIAFIWAAWYVGLRAWL